MSTIEKADLGNVFDLSVVICTYDRTALLERCLNSLAKQVVDGRFQWEIIVVGNNAPRETEKMITIFHEKIRERICLYYINEEKQGKTFAMNRGVSVARGKIIAFTDDDTLLPSDWIQLILDAFQKNNCDGIGGKVVARWDIEKPDWSLQESPYQLKGVILEYDKGEAPFLYRDDVALPIGANMAFRRETFDRFGLFHTYLGYSGRKMISGEDTEFCKRVIEGGGTIMYRPEILVGHSVQKERVTKRFFRKWYYGFGETVTLVGIFPKGVKMFLGVPRYELKELFRSIVLWVRHILSGNKNARFFYQLQALQRIGMLRGALRRWTMNLKPHELPREPRYDA